MPELHLPQIHAPPPHDHALSGQQRARIERGLREAMHNQARSEVRFGRHDRMLYATDASIYQVEPLGVVVPGDIDDAARAAEYCLEHGLPILPRGGGTSLAGQCVNRAIVIDFSAHCSRIGKVDLAQRRVHVEPGVILEQLNAHLAPHGLMFGPDVATASQANLGGMIGNNSAGARSLRYGRTGEHLIALDALLTDGSRITFDEGAAARDPRIALLTQRIADIILPLASLIDERYPKTVRNVGGYGLDRILQQMRARTPESHRPFDRVNLAHLLAGSEGTLAVTLGATLNIVDRPKARPLALIAYDSVDDALAAVPALLTTNPSAVELVDDMVLDLARRNLEYQQYARLMPRGAHGGDPQAVLYAEYFADDAQDARDARERLADVARDHPTLWCVDPIAIEQAWKLRKAGEPLLYGLPGDRKPLTFIEDTAVEPAKLRDFVRDFRALLERHGTHAAFYAHASVGCLHIRPLVNLKDGHEREMMERIAHEAADLVLRYGGAISGEHGDGRLRSHLLERTYGREIVGAFRAIKAVFDPRNLLNPGNIVGWSTLSEPVSGTESRSTMTEQRSIMMEHLRIRPEDHDVLVPREAQRGTYFRYAHENGFEHAVEMCNGAGVCRQRSGGTMCPSYRGTLDERHSTRGRGNALRLAITGQLGESAAPQWDDAETLRTLDLCLSCKACKSECPSNVDIARLKAEYLAQTYRQRGRAPWRSRLFGQVRALNRMGSRVPAVANVMSRITPMRAMMGIDARRSLPRFEQSIFAWWKRRPAHHASPDERPAVILFSDCFTAYNEPHIARAAVSALEAIGCRVIVEDQGCCGRAAVSLGLLDDAVETIARTAARLDALVQRERAEAILFCEPSCQSAVIDDWRDLRLEGAGGAPPRERIEQLACMSTAVEDFVADRLDPAREAAADDNRRTILLHGHCHQKALWSTNRTARLLQELSPTNAVRVLDSGCCGMAGSFGYMKNHFDLSQRIGELALFPALRAEPDAIVLAPGTSCRHQVRDALRREALHPIELIAQTMAGRTSRDEARCDHRR